MTIKFFPLSQMDSLVAFLLIQSAFPIEETFSGFHNDYLQPDQTQTINGYFTLYIVFTHSYEYPSEWISKCNNVSGFLWTWNHGHYRNKARLYPINYI